MTSTAGRNHFDVQRILDRKREADKRRDHQRLRAQRTQLRSQRKSQQGQSERPARTHEKPIGPGKETFFTASAKVLRRNRRYGSTRYQKFAEKHSSIEVSLSQREEKLEQTRKKKAAMTASHAEKVKERARIH